jgi:hypothetical protein
MQAFFGSVDLAAPATLMRSKAFIYMNVLIDSGAEHSFPLLADRSQVSDSELVITTHEYCDHIRANWHFQKHSLIRHIA